MTRCNNGRFERSEAESRNLIENYSNRPLDCARGDEQSFCQTLQMWCPDEVIHVGN